MNWFSGVLMERLLVSGASVGDMICFALIIGVFSAMLVASFSLMAPTQRAVDSLPPQIFALFVVVPMLVIIAGPMSVVMLLGTVVILNLMLLYLNHGFVRG